jgi:ABC-2 type transport system ATP-binding protein
MSNYIEAKGITKVVGGIKKEKIVDNLSLTLKAGEVVGLLGPNGAGKTTTMKMLLGLTKITSGTAQMLGERVPKPLSRAGVGFLPESVAHPDYLTVLEYLKYHASLNEYKCDDKEIIEQLKRVEMLEFKDRLLKECSKGMRQRTDIARILLNHAKIVFLDEPFSGLDPCGQVMLKDIIAGLKKQGIAVLVNSHAVGNLADICDRVCIMDKGKLLVDDSLESLLNTNKYELSLAFAEAEGLAEFLKHRSDISQKIEKETEVTLELEGKEDADKILSEALGAGAKVLRLAPVYLSLDQLFVKVLGEAALVAESEERVAGEVK